MFFIFINRNEPNRLPMALKHLDDHIANLRSLGSSTSVDHPIIQNLNNAVFKKIITFTDQAIMILNHSTFKYDYVSENIVNICGISSSDFMASGGELSMRMRHAEDLHYLNTVAYPEYYRCMDS